jgi:ABC-2 type transport system ATP-binding protein
VQSASDEVRSWIGYLPDVPGFYTWMTGREFLRFAGGLFGLSGSTLDDRIESLLHLAGLQGVDTRVGGYSRGMKQRLGLAQALINAPRLLLLDEPTSALDPIGRKAVLDMIGALAGRTTIFFSTHILADVERVCNTVAILDRGRVVADAPIGDLLARKGAHGLIVELGTPDGAQQIADDLAGADWLRDITRSNATLRLSVADMDQAAQVIPQRVVARGLLLRRLEPVEATLEEVFVDLVGEAER